MNATARRDVLRALKSCLGHCSDQASVVVPAATSAQLAEGIHVQAEFRLGDGSRLNLWLSIDLRPAPKEPGRLMIEGPR